MGQGETKESSFTINKDWQTIAENAAHPFFRINPFSDRTYYNPTTDEYVEEYVVQFSSEDEFNNYARQMQKRIQKNSLNNEDQKNFANQTSLSSPYIYPIKQFVNISDLSLCSTIFKGIVYIEKVELRLKEINDIPLTDQLYLLSSILEGFRILYQKAGYFDICEEMVFITKEGKVRVWLNPNLSKNEPFSTQLDQNSYLHQQGGSQSQMIVKLINMIQNNAFPENRKIMTFKQFLQRRGIFDRLSFFRALEQLQVYCYQHSLIISDHMQSVYQLFQDKPENQASEQYQSIIFGVDDHKRMQIGGSSVNYPYQRHKKSYSSERFNRQSVLISSANNGKYRKKVKCSNFAKEKARKGSKVIKNYGQTTLEKPELILQSKSTHSEKYDEDQQNEKALFLELNSSFEKLQKEEKLKKIFTFNEQQSFNKQNQSTHTKRNEQVSFQNHNQVFPQVIKFNYCSSKHQTKPSEQFNKDQLNTVNTFNSHSTVSEKPENIEKRQQNKVKESSSTLDFYSPHHTYTLDAEIAEDLKNILKFQL